MAIISHIIRMCGQNMSDIFSWYFYITSEERHIRIVDRSLISLFEYLMEMWNENKTYLQKKKNTAVNNHS